MLEAYLLRFEFLKRHCDCFDDVSTSLDSESSAGHAREPIRKPEWNIAHLRKLKVSLSHGKSVDIQMGSISMVIAP